MTGHDRAPVVIRRGRPEEAASLQGIEKAARARYAGFHGLEFAAAAPPIAADRLMSAETWVAEIQGTPVGFALVQQMDGALYLANLSVAPTVSGRGVGDALLRRVMDRAAELDLSAITLATFRLPRWNGPWFRKHGFVPVSDAEVGPGLRAVLERHAGFLDMTQRETLWCRLR